MSVRFRSRGECEAALETCQGQASHFHHRKLRRHGDNSEANCLHVCAVCHSKIHSMGTAAYLMGLLVKSFDDPATIPAKRGSRG